MNLPHLDHPGMTRMFFDDAVRRAHEAGLQWTVDDDDRMYVSSSTTPGLWYKVSRINCQCEGHHRSGRCLHRAFAIAVVDVFGLARKEEAA
jgi:hypothetical protein